jgi:hypothetical protein
MTKRIFLLAGIVILLLTLWLGSTIFFFVRTYARSSAADKAIAARAGIITAVLGAPDGPPDEPPIPYDAPGGQAAVLEYSKVLNGRLLHVSCGISAPPGLPNAEGPYEVAIFTSRPTSGYASPWAPDVIRNISIFAKTSAINPGDTFSLKDLTSLNPTASTLLFVRYKSITFDGKPGQVLLGIAVTPQELEFARKYGNADLIQKLKDNGIFPISYLNRGSVVDPGAPMVTALEGRKNRQKMDLNDPARTPRKTRPPAAGTKTAPGAQPSQDPDDESDNP